MSRLRLWDLPVRLTHWAIVLLLIGLYLTGEVGGFDVQVPGPGEKTWFLSNMDVHALLGQGVFVLVVFRVLWGLFGSSTARFTSFVRSPGAAFAYLRGAAGGRIPHWIGHNPAGAWMVLLLLSLLAAQSVTGMLSSDEFFFSGPLAHLIGSDASESVTRIHKGLFNVLLGAAALHVLAAVVYRLKGHNLIAAMVDGRARFEPEAGTPTPQFRPWWTAWIALAAAAAVLWALRQL